MTETIITTPYQRTLTVSEGWEGEGSKHLNIKTSTTGTHLSDTLLPAENVNELIAALLGDNATVITDLPKVEVSINGHYAAAGDVQRRLEYYTADNFLTTAKNYLALHAFLVKRDAEKEAAKVAEAEAAKAAAEAEAAKAAAEAEKAKEAALKARRDELAGELWGYGATYSNRTTYARAAIDRIIDLEEAAKVS